MLLHTVRNIHKKQAILLWPLLLSAVLEIRAATVAFSYADSRSLVTLEFIDRNQAVLNYFNLSHYVVVFKAQNLWMVDTSGAMAIGQVMKEEKATQEEETYLGSMLLQPWTYISVDVLGAFPPPADISQVYLIMGGKRQAMRKTEPSEMEELAARIEGADLSLKDGPQILQRINIKPRGQLTYPTGEQDELEISVTRILGPEEINPPRIIKKPNPPLTEEARKAGIRSAQVKLSVSLSKNGEISDVKVIKGAEYGLDERAVATVKNSWKFLPATQHAETVDTNLTLNVVFQSTEDKRQDPK